MRRVVITGLGVITPIGLNCRDFFDGLRAGKNGIRLVTHFNTQDQPVRFAGTLPEFAPEKYIEPKDVKHNDRYVQIALAAAREALDDNVARLKENNVDFNRFGVIFGSGVGGLMTLYDQHNVYLEKGARRVSPFLIPMIISNIAAGELAISYGLKGPNFNTTSACAAGLHAMGEAFRYIRYGGADLMVTGGSEAALTPLAMAGFAACKALSRDNDNFQTACRPFDKNRNGFVMAEGGAVFLFEELENARARGATILAEVIGCGATADAYHITAPAPNGEGAARCMALALKDAGLRPEQVEYINAHGTSTEHNDRNETIAIKTVFGDHARKLSISATKSMIGHTLGAAGPLGAAATILALRDHLVHPTINFTTPDPDCDLDFTFNQPKEREVRVGLINSFGFGGHNACLILRKWE